MKYHKVFLICLITVMMVFNSCAKMSTSGSDNTESINSNNSFFFQNGESIKKYNGTFDIGEDEWVKAVVTLQIINMGSYQNGALYNIKINVEGSELSKKLTDNSGEYINDFIKQLNLGYLYVEEGEIYKYPVIDNISTMSLGIINLPACYITCQEEELKDTLGAEEKGWHSYVMVNGDQRESHLYNSAVETGYYEHITWEKGVGLVHYESGYGAERQKIELELIRSGE